MSTSISDDVMQCLDQTYDEIHIVHRPEGAREPSRWSDDDDGWGRSYLTIVRRGAKHDAMTVHDVFATLRHWRPDGTKLAGWRIIQRRFDESEHPRCIRVSFILAPARRFDWQRDPQVYGRVEQYFASYDAVADCITASIPHAWSWYITRLHELAARDPQAPRPRGPRPDTLPTTPVTEHELYKKLSDLIARKAKADGAIRGTSKRFRIETLAGDLNTPRRTLERQISKLTSRPPADVVKDIRLELARELLPSCSTVKEAANRVGYTQSHFTKLFRSKYGMSPVDLRQP